MCLKKARKNNHHFQDKNVLTSGKREYYQNCSMLDCVIQCLQSAAYFNEQFLQVQHIGFLTLETVRHA